MDDVLDVIGEATAAGEKVVVATVIDTIRSAPRQPGAKMIVRENGTFVGSVSGGCVEADVVERAKQIFAGEDARRVHYGVSDGEAWEVGLSCGGEIDVWLEPADPELWTDVRALLDSDGYGMLYTNTSTGEKRLERGVLEGAGLREDGMFAEVIEGPLRVVIFGAAEAAEHLCAYGKQLGWRTTVVDARAALATPERVPSADRVIKAWPDEVAAELIDERTIVVTLSHEERLDVPAIAAALQRNARYIGAIGAKRTQERRRAALIEQGFGGRPRPDPRSGRPRSRRPFPGPDRARDRGRDRLGHLGRRQEEQAPRRCCVLALLRARRPRRQERVPAPARRRPPSPSPCARSGGRTRPTRRRRRRAGRARSEAARAPCDRPSPG